MKRHSFYYGGKIIEFDVERKNVKNINLNVRPDMSIVVSANERVPEEYLLKFVKTKADWIVKNVGFFKRVQPENHQEKLYLSGEAFKYLGKQYRLKVEDAQGKESVKFYRGYLYIYVIDKKNHKRKKSLVESWYQQKAKEKFLDSLKRMYPLIEKYSVVEPDIQMKIMKARWGSCIQKKQLILLNRELIKAPKFCIDYVVLHELVHFKYPNHNQDFYDFMTSLMPDWKQRKQILDEEVVREL